MLDTRTAARAVARRHARGGGGRRLPRRVHAALPSRECVARGARAVRRRVAARVRVAGALGRREGGGRVDERAAVRAGGVVGCGGVVHVPAVGGGELGRAGARARGGRRAADGARAWEATVEVSNNAREYTSASARLRLVWARVLGV